MVVPPEGEGDSSVESVPIVVQRSSMRVVDCMHRPRAAAYRRDAGIGVRFFDGDDEEAFVVVVEMSSTLRGSDRGLAPHNGEARLDVARHLQRRAS